ALGVGSRRWWSTCFPYTTLFRSSSMTKLSSGFRINRAADDAAGLGIANRLRSTTRSLTQAARNAEQTNSLLQIAEGATGTIQKIDRKSTRLHSSHVKNSYAVLCL